MKRRKKAIISLIIVLIILISTPFGVFSIDQNRIRHGEKPIFCEKYFALLDGGTVACQYYGYQMIKWNRPDNKSLEIRVYSNYYNPFDKGESVQ